MAASQWCITGAMLVCIALLDGCGARDDPPAVSRHPEREQWVARREKSFVFEEPKRIHAEVPRYPHAAWASGREGWAEVCFRVEPDGSTSDIRVADASSRGGFSEAAVKAAAGYRFEPARLDGEAVPYNDQCLIVQFLLEGPRGVRLAFRSRYRKIQTLVGEKRLDEARAEIDQAFEQEPFNLNELSALYLSEYAYFTARGERHEAVQALERASRHLGVFLEGKKLAGFSRALFGEYMTLNKFREAREIFVTMDPEAQKDPEVAKAIREIDNLEEHGENFAVPAKIMDHNGDDPACWRHRPLFHALAIDDVEGHIEDVFVDCERRDASLPFQGAATWEIPESWGSCRLRVCGDAGTRFRLIEYGRPANGDGR